MKSAEPCIFCFTDPTIGTRGIEADRIVDGYDNWWLVLQPEQKRNITKHAAGMLIAKRHFEIVSMATADESVELLGVIKQAAASLCQATDTEYLGQETVGFNQGPYAGQTVDHAHVHILPVSSADPLAMFVRGGMMGAFETLRAERLRED